jgi:hypothetical protein
MQSRERQYFAGGLNVDPIGFCQHMHVIAAQFAVEKTIA